MATWNRKNSPVSQSDSSANEKDAAVARISAAIADENVKIDKLYLSIGKKYAESHAVDYEETFSQEMKEIAASQKKLVDYSMQMQFVTGVIICKNCGHKAPKGSVFCNMCGSKLPEIDFDNYEMCSRCGSLVEKGQQICPNCSRPMRSADTSRIQCPHCKEFVGKENKFCPICGKELEDTVAPFRGKPGGKKCPNPNCGAIMNDDMLFCTECGSRLDR